MAEHASFTPPPTGPNPPAGPEGAQSIESLQKALRDTKATLTRTQQELASMRGDPPPEDDDFPGDYEDFGDEPNDDYSPPEGDDGDSGDQGSEGGDSLDDAARKMVDQAGLDATPFVEEYARTGDVSDEGREKLAEGLKGILGANARTVIDDYIAAKKASAQNDQQLYLNAAGGSESYNRMVAWARENWSPEEIDAYNRAVSSGDRHTTMFAVDSLRAKYERANGANPKLLRGNAPRRSLPPYRTAFEMRQDMSDPRYKQDPAFRDRVKKRLAISKI